MIDRHAQGVKPVELKERVIAAVRGQFGRPTGVWGRAAGVVMAHRSSNRRRNEWAVSLLDVRPRDRVLEIGFGPGLAINELGRLLRSGGVIAVAHQPRGPGASDGVAARDGREIKAALAEAGFSEVRLETMALKPAVVCTLGVNRGDA
jgi:hypothetical protein